MTYPELERYDELQLARMLDSYRELSRTHADKGHYALAKWALGFCTAITIEMNSREMQSLHTANRQLSLDEAHYPEGLAYAED